LVDAPQIGQIVEHHFLWIAQHAASETEGRKARPCLIIAVERSIENAPPRVTVLPITSPTPTHSTTAVAIPSDIKARIGLDRRRPAWIVINQANMFTWPGFDLVPQHGGGFVRGVITRGFFATIRDAVIELRSRGASRVVSRDE